MKTCIALLAIMATGISFSQQKDSLKTKNPRFVVKMTHGMTNQNDVGFTNSEWEKMTPGFSVPDSLTENLWNHYGQNIHSFTNDSYYMFSFGLINGKDHQAGKKYRTTTTFHLGYGPELQASKSWSHEVKQVVDTLVSSQTGDSYYVKSVRRQDVSKQYKARSIVFGIGQHFATNPERIFQFETGVDLLCVISIMSSVRASFSDWYTFEGLPDLTMGNSYPYPNNIAETKFTEYDGKTIAGVIMRIPLEMSFKLSKKNNVAGRMRIGGELNPGMAAQFTKGLITSNFSMSGGMNFRFAF
jgi:hypothetical protein